MKELYDGVVGIAALVGAASCLLLVSAEPASAQRGSAGTRSVERRIETMNRQGEEYERDRAARERKGSAGDADGRRRAQAVTQQVKHDFEGLQAGYNQIVLAMSSGGRLDSDSVSHAVAEVRKSAARLKHNLALPQAKDEKAQQAPGEADAAPLEESLQTLCRHIYSFVTNPIFEGPGVIDVEQAGKAGRDLDTILKLSESIRKSGDGPKARHD